jgi:ParB family chromosome partitioning protein
MAFTHEAVLKRRDVFEVDPRKVKVQVGWNPRVDFSGEEELMASIIENGVLDPITIKVVDDDLILVDGERRLRATMRAIGEGYEIASIPAMLAKRGISDIDALFVTLLKNDSKPLAPIEEAAAYRRFLAWGIDPAEIGRRMGRSEQHVKNRIALDGAAPDLKAAVAEGEIGIEAARVIIVESKGSIEKQKESVKKAKEGMAVVAKTMSRKKLEKLAASLIEEYRGMLFSSEKVQGRHEGVIAGLLMALHNNQEPDWAWIKKAEE